MVEPHDVHLLVLSTAPLCLKSPTSLVSMAWQTKNRNPASALSSTSCTHTGRLRRALVFTAGGAAGLEAARGTADMRGTDRVSVQEEELVSLNSVRRRRDSSSHVSLRGRPAAPLIGRRQVALEIHLKNILIKNKNKKKVYIFTKNKRQ